MKHQEFINWDEFNPDEWNPIPDNKEFYFAAPDWKFTGGFSFNTDHEAWRGSIQELVEIAFDTKFYYQSKVINTIHQQLDKWGLNPNRVSWDYSSGRIRPDGTFDNYLWELVNPHPNMHFDTYEDNEDCYVDSSVAIIQQTSWIEVHWNHYISCKANNITAAWNKFLELSKKRVNIPFTATLRYRGEEL